MLLSFREINSYERFERVATLSREGEGVIEPHWQLDNITVGLRNNEEILFVIVNDRSRYCSVARECLFKKRRKKKGREGKGRKKNVYSREGSIIRDITWKSSRSHSNESSFFSLSFHRSPKSRGRTRTRFSKAWMRKKVSMLRIDETRERKKIRVHFPVNAWICVYIYIYDCQVLKGERALKLRGMSNDGAVAATVQIRWGWSLISSRIHVDCTDGRALAKIRAPLLILISGGIGTRININSSINSNILERIPPPDPFDHYDHFRFTIVCLCKNSR